MHRSFRPLLLVVAAACLAAPAALPAAAGTLAGVTLPDTVEVDGHTLHLNGMGLREATFLRIDVYVAGLYLEHPTHDAAAILADEGPVRMVMHFVRSVPARKLVHAWHEGFEHVTGKDAAEVHAGEERLCSWMEDVSAGDEIVLTGIPGKGVEVTVKGRVRGTIPGRAFARALWGIWLGPNPPGEELKEGLLGLADD